MNESKELKYNGYFGKDDNPLPKVKFEDIPVKRRKELRCKRLCNVSIIVTN